MHITGSPYVRSVRNVHWVGFPEKQNWPRKKKIEPSQMSPKSRTCEIKTSTTSELALVLFQAEQETQVKEKDASCPRRRCTCTARAGKLKSVRQTSVYFIKSGVRQKGERA